MPDVCSEMTMAVCGSCGKTFAAHARAIGHVGNCPHCREEIRVRLAPGASLPRPLGQPQVPAASRPAAEPLERIARDVHFIAGVLFVFVALTLLTIGLTLVRVIMIASQ